MKKKLLSLLIVGVMLLTLLPVQLYAADDVMISQTAIGGVTAPVKGETPVSAVTETEQYTGTVAWDPAPATTFAADTKYTATITIAPKSGYTLTGIPADYFTVAGAATVTNTTDSGIVTAVFPNTAANIISIKQIDGVTPPVKGATPAASITSTDEFTGTVTWDPAPSSTFAAGTAYTATITISPKAGYTLTGIGADFFTVAGATTVTHTTDSSIVTAKFPETDPPDPPQLVSAETSLNGDRVILTFDKAMADPSGNVGSFAVKINGLQADYYDWSGYSSPVTRSISISSAALNTDQNKIDLILNDSLQRGDIVTVDYSPGTVSAADGTLLAGFASQPVTNMIPVNITSNLEGTWQAFDHVGHWNEAPYPTGDDSRGNAFNRHIVISGAAVTFYGNGILPFIDFLYLPSNDTAAKGFTYDLDLACTDWHTLEGGGFLFNTVINGGYLSGYAALFSEAEDEGESYTVKLYKIDHVDVNALHNYNISYNYSGLSAYSGVTLLDTFPVMTAGTQHRITLETSSATLNMWDGTTQLITNYSLPTGYGNGVGLIGSYISHGCSSLSYFTFSNLKIQGIADLSAVLAGDQANLTFTKPEGATSVIVEQSTDAGATWAPATVTSPITSESTTATVTGLTGNRTYYFRLDINGGKYDGYSRVASVVHTSTVPTTPVSEPSRTYIYYTLTIDKTGEGTVLPGVGNHTYDSTTTVMLYATPAEGYTFEGWQGTTGSSVVMDGNKKVTAVFKKTVTEPVPEPTPTPTPTPEPVVIDDETPPTALPKTGGIPAGLFYGLGGVITAAGIFLRKNKKNQ